MATTLIQPEPCLPLVHALAELRARGVRQCDVASDAGIYPQRLSEYALGRSVPARAVAERISAAVGVDVERMWPGLGR